MKDFDKSTNVIKVLFKGVYPQNLVLNLLTSEEKINLEWKGLPNFDAQSYKSI